MALYKELIIDTISALNWCGIRTKNILFAERTDLRVLVYHAVHKGIELNVDPAHVNVKPELFEKQMEALRLGGFTFVSLERACNILSGKERPVKKCILLTFDDAYRHILETAIPYLQKYNIPAVVFVATEYAQATKEYPWISSTGLLQAMGWDELIGLPENFSIGSHSRTHRNIASLNKEEMAEEIAASKSEIQNRVRRPVCSFAYPYGFYGSFSPETENLLKKHDYTCAFTNIYGPNRAGDNLFTLRRMRVHAQDSSFKLIMKLEGAYDWIDSLKKIRQHI